MAEQSRKNDQRHVVDDFKIAERQLESIGKSQHESFSGDHHGITRDFQHDAEGHDGASDKAHGNAQRPGFRDERVGYPHAEVDEHTENKHAGQLKELPWSEGLAEKGNLSQQHERVDAERTRTHGKAENFSHHIGNAGNGRGSQLGIGDHGNAVAHEKKTEKENKPALAALFGVGTFHFLCR